MAKKKTAAETSDEDNSVAAPVAKVATELQRPSAEVLYAEELTQLIEADADQPKPLGWQMSPRSVLTFVLGDPGKQIAPKFVGRRGFLERCIVSLATNRGLMLIGEPGTAKSYLSELLAAAISGDSTLTIQGSAGTTEDNIKYSWNYALLVSEGPSDSDTFSERVRRSRIQDRGVAGGKPRCDSIRCSPVGRCHAERWSCRWTVRADVVVRAAQAVVGCEFAGGEMNVC